MLCQASHLQDALDEESGADVGHLVGARPPPPECASSGSSVSSFSAASSASVSPVNSNTSRASGDVASQETTSAASSPGKLVSPTEMMTGCVRTSPITVRRGFPADEAVDGCKLSCKKALKRGKSRQWSEEKGQERGSTRRKGSAAAVDPSLNLLCCGMDSGDEENNLGSVRTVLSKWKPFGWGAQSRKRS